jgi:ATP-dependent DNA helicase RecG
MKLTHSVGKLPLVGPIYLKRLEKLGIFTIEDLLHHIPHRYIDYRRVFNIAEVQAGERVTIKGKVKDIKNIYTKGRKKIQKAHVADITGNIEVIWFNQTYLIKAIKKGYIFSFSGKVDFFDRKRALISPEYENITNKPDTIHTGRLVPIYPETYGVSSKWLRGRTAYAIDKFKDQLEEFLPVVLLKKYSYPVYKKALTTTHFPDSLEQTRKARERLAFNELLFYQLKSQYRKKDWEKVKPTHNLSLDNKLLSSFLKSLPFKLTKSQRRSIKEIFKDLASDTPMNRLLEGDVGAGKTVVAAAGAFVSFVNGFQSVFMAPTQILAHQHYLTLKQIFNKFKLRVSLTTSAGIKKNLGITDIFVGTHALIHKKVNFDNVSLVVIDEQHRFGVEQRAHLVQKSGKNLPAQAGRVSPHVLTMTATPIPRTVALTVYGDLDLSTLDELPTGRKPVTTWLVPPQKRGGAYEWIKEQIKKDQIQVFIICPLIEESEKETMKQVKAATQEFEKLKDTFKNFKVSLLHGKLKMNEKNRIIEKFKKGKSDILVSTPVVEVGIDVPNATIMIIEGADRFGLAQLHQLRGRIGRGEKKSYCLLFTQSRSTKVLTRLKALKENKSGFELAEIDLRLRGPGEIFGIRQHGFPELKIASWQDTRLIKRAKKVAQDAVENKKKYTKLIKKLKKANIVFN